MTDHIVSCLQSLGFPLVSDVSPDDLFSAGILRIRIVESMLSLFDPDTYFPALGPVRRREEFTSPEDFIGHLCLYMAALGICAPADRISVAGLAEPPAENFRVIAELVQLAALHVQRFSSKASRQKQPAELLADQHRNDTALLQGLAAQASHVFRPRLDLLPPDIAKRISPSHAALSCPSLQSMQVEGDRLRLEAEQLRLRLGGLLEERDAHDLDEAYEPVVDSLALHLSDVGRSVRQFNDAFVHDFEPWTSKTLETPLLGIGPAARSVLESHTFLLSFLDGLRKMRSSNEFVSRHSLGEFGAQASRLSQEIQNLNEKTALIMNHPAAARR